MVLTFSIILPVYKESNIYLLIKKLLAQAIPKEFYLQKIFIVGLGFNEQDLNKIKKILLIKEMFRKGKATAISTALKNVKSDIVILQSSDTIPSENTLNNILLPFLGKGVGMVTGRPLSTDNPKTFAGFLNHLIWYLHHIISLSKPKGGEIIAFRNILRKLPHALAADEAYIEYKIHKNGLKIVYSPTAVVYNKGPRKIKDFIKQRERIYVGHLHIKGKYGYFVSTISIVAVVNALFKFFRLNHIKNFREHVWIVLAIFLEVYARFLGMIDYYVMHRLPYKWEIIKSAK